MSISQKLDAVPGDLIRLRMGWLNVPMYSDQIHYDDGGLPERQQLLSNDIGLVIAVPNKFPFPSRRAFILSQRGTLGWVNIDTIKTV